MGFFLYLFFANRVTLTRTGLIVLIHALLKFQTLGRRLV